ncbi:myb-like protein X isoform X2 [Lingula anatina]|nr:myb-like protein X isoform X2 [Lingula anatina]|eukprot:XP_013400411.1 myb-like protein X isoform X2 [Lingula anatina]
MTKEGYIHEEEHDERILVDFQRKTYEAIIEKRHEERQIKETEDKEREPDVDIPPPADPEEEWVDYVDSLGRSRRCMKKDLPELINMDKGLGKETRNVKSTNEDLSSKPSLVSNDMYKEMLRQKWEKEALEDLNKPVGDVHYANVQFDEIRTHGVGYYQFAKDETTRKQQMDMLGKLRDQTQDQRSKREIIKEKRKAQLQARLAKVRQRKGIKEEEKETDVEVKEKEDMIGPGVTEKLIEARTISEREIEDKKRATAPVREWDKEKKSVEASWNSCSDAERVAEFAPPDNYFDTAVPKKRARSDPRDERLEEFAPPPSYYQQSSEKSWKNTLKSNNKLKTPNSEELKINTTKMCANEANLSKPSSSKNSGEILEMPFKKKLVREITSEAVRDLSHIPLPPTQVKTKESVAESKVECPMPPTQATPLLNPISQEQLPNPFVSQQLQPSQVHANISPFGQYPVINSHTGSTFGTNNGMSAHSRQNCTVSEHSSHQTRYGVVSYMENANKQMPTYLHETSKVPSQVSHMSEEDYKRLVRNLPSSLPAPPTQDQPLPVYPSQADPYSWDRYEAPAAKPISVGMKKAVDRTSSAFSVTLTEMPLAGDSECTREDSGQEKTNKRNTVSKTKWKHGAAAENARQSSESVIGETLKYFRQLTEKRSNDKN